MIGLDEIAPIDLGNHSWSRVIVNATTVHDNCSALGYSVFAPGLVTSDLSHSTEELAFVVSGSGRIRLEDDEIAVTTHDAIFIPAGAWHTIVVDGDEELVMVFTFPWSDYPPTERQESRR
ncbi:MAG TPA: cupin domain-containing protein [Acidimicrobiales bacterium]|nr:cupin domain-containing protein [Acidimicrobiales bacterium]